MGERSRERGGDDDNAYVHGLYLDQTRTLYRLVYDA